MYKAILEVNIFQPALTLAESDAWARFVERAMLEGMDYLDELINFVEGHECEEGQAEYEMDRAAKLDRILNQRRQLTKKLIEKIRKLQGEDA